MPPSKAAIHEFSHEGVAGARTDAIARAAKVNKALLYYYFKDKDALYGAVLDHVFSGLRRAIERELDRDLPPRKKILAYAGAHCDYVASNPRFPRVGPDQHDVGRKARRAISSNALRNFIWCRSTQGSAL